MRMKIVAVVPIKLNSERLPNKNIKVFEGGMPLCYYIFKTLKRLRGVDEIYVYCSDTRVIDYVPSGVRFLQRSENLDKNTTKINEVLSAFANDVVADVYVMTHATSPFIKSDSIQRGLDAVKEGGYDSAFAVKKIQDFLWKDGRPLNYDLDNIPRSQDIEPLWEETSGFYIYERGVIMEKNRRIGDKPYMVEVNGIEATDINTPEDWEIANTLFKAMGDKL